MKKTKDIKKNTKIKVNNDKILKNNKKLDLELKRLETMKEYEKKYSDKIVCGIDEAGRGPLAGPVVAACVVLDKKNDILYLNDSKKLSEKKRDLLFNEIKEKALAYGIGIIDNNIIDKINILEATHLAMKEALDNADKMYFDKYNKHIEVALVDALKIKNVDIMQEPIIKGDAKSISIAAASIIAKVTRDRLMLEYDALYPEYDFKKNKAYGTKFHMAKLREIGPTPIHRKTFIKFLNNENDNFNEIAVNDGGQINGKKGKGISK